MPQVVIFQRRLTRYRVPLFTALRDQLAPQGVELRVVYGPPGPGELTRKDAGYLSWGLEVPAKYLRLGNTRVAWHALPWELFFAADLVILPQENALLANYPVFLTRRLKRRPVAFWGHGANFQGNPEGLSEKIKAHLSRQVDWWFAYTALSVDRVSATGFPSDRITCLNNAVDAESLTQWRGRIQDKERARLLAKLGLVGRCVGISIGSLAEEKRLGFLFGAADEIRRQIKDFELVLIGDGPECDYVRTEVAHRPWCRWVGARHQKEKALYLSLGQVLLNPGMVGLGVLDSFAMGLPMVTTDCGLHSPEIAYLVNGQNGLITEDRIDAFANAVAGLLANDGPRKAMAASCLADLDRYTLDSMVTAFVDGIIRALHAGESGGPSPVRHVSVIWQRFLPYHLARLRHLQEHLEGQGVRLTAIEVASQDATYGFPPGQSASSFEWQCLFPGVSYHAHSAENIHGAVIAALRTLRPDAVLAPASAFPEGMAAVHYGLESGCRTVMMDDAWAHTDQRGALTRHVKRHVHQNIDSVFVPADFYRGYYRGLGFPDERIVVGVDVVDNRFFADGAESARHQERDARVSMPLPEKYFLFVGRFLPRKGLEVLLEAFSIFRQQAGSDGWGLVLVGDGPHRPVVEQYAANVADVHFAGVKQGADLCRYYGLAGALVVPSESDPWGLVVNEGMASGLPVLVSRGCGAAHTLVREGENGWTFEAGDVPGLASLLTRLASLPPDVRRGMGACSSRIIDEWSLERFAQGVDAAIQLPRRPPGGLISRLTARFWKGRVSVN